MGTTFASPGVELRAGIRSQSIRIDFLFRGVRCREALKLSHTKQNIAYAIRRRGEVLNAIERGTFVYSEFFPDSPRVHVFESDDESDKPRVQKHNETVGQLLRDYLQIADRNLARSSANCYRDVANTHLFPRWGEAVAGDVTSKELRLWIGGLTAKRKTIQLILTPLRNAFEQAVCDGILESSPLDNIKLKKILAREQLASDFEADPFDIDEIEAILTSCDREGEHNMFEFAFTTGMRPSEYIALTWGAVNFVKHDIAVQGAFVDGEAKKTGKTDASLRRIDMRHGAYEALLAQQKHTKLAGQHVFLNPVTREQWDGDKQIRCRWRRILLAAGVRYRNPYQTRHTFASSLLMLGANPLYVATQMGHRDTTMVTRHYGKWIGTGLDRDKRERLLRMFIQRDDKRRDEFPVFA